jgi:hypothetical protein
MRYRLLLATAFAAMLGMGATTGAHAADPQVWVSDANGNIGLVDVVTGGVTDLHNTGHVLTDIGFVGGTLYGATFTDLYSVSTTTGAATHVGAFTAGGGGMNALVGNGGSLLGASVKDNNLFTINPATAAAAVTGVLQPGVSAGDLTFAGGALYASQVDPANGSDMLVNATTGTKIGDFTAGGGTLANVFGLATTAGQVYAVAGTQVYSVNLSTGALTPLGNWSSSQLGQAFGEAAAAAPGPNTGKGLLGFAAMTALLIGVRYRGLFV